MNRSATFKKPLNKFLLISFSFGVFGYAQDCSSLVPEELALFDHSEKLYQGLKSYQTFLLSWLTQAQNLFKQLGIDPENEKHSRQLYISLKALLDFCEKDGQVTYKGLIPLYDWKKDQLTTLLDKVALDEDPFLSGLLLALNIPLSKETQQKIRQNKESKVQQKILKAYLSSQKQNQASSLSEEKPEKEKAQQDFRNSRKARGSQKLRNSQTARIPQDSPPSTKSRKPGITQTRSSRVFKESHRGPQWRRYTKGSEKWYKYRQYQLLIGN